MKKKLRFLPVLLLGLLVASLAWRLANPPDNDVKSGMVGSHVPKFAAPQVLAEVPGVTSLNLADGKPKLVNFFASWCVPCVGEAPVLTTLKQQGVTIVGIAVRDRPTDIRQFLNDNGNPFDRIGSDPQSAVQLSFGSSGVPETFVVDGKGVIQLQHIGPIEPDDIPSLEQALGIEP